MQSKTLYSIFTISALLLIGLVVLFKYPANAPGEESLGPQVHSLKHTSEALQNNAVVMLPTVSSASLALDQSKPSRITFSELIKAPAKLMFGEKANSSGSVAIAVAMVISASILVCVPLTVLFIIYMNSKNEQLSQYESVCTRRYFLLPPLFLLTVSTIVLGFPSLFEGLIGKIITFQNADDSTHAFNLSFVLLFTVGFGFALSEYGFAGFWIMIELFKGVMFSRDFRHGLQKRS
ncbi:hypothetical protein MDAP_002761 [Mitosporidium daphniae]|uniref:Uncharacterized protein n=1 Tax=Mitosporidium daphniae TaxID=1485682 RepID=A0A098VT61_9MICR|nr:uncharacterized protein DI09_1p370 [Mitosporidium daphniae]KGG52187.1 hypothetical protein DI09_1p370 [Mitosporidium daphniae]|eukprot:XP_013238614.1 uncharacterized protein DI09_1p370 [Mitosporidium daphniae]